MPHRRRQQDAAHAFAWPPTREDLDLIEIVDPDTLRPVHAQYNEPEPVQLDLLKSVAPVRPVRTPLPTPVSQLETPPVPAPLVLVRPPQPPVLIRTQTQTETQALTRIPAPAMLPLARRRFDPTWLVAACGFGAIALSAYFSLHPSPSMVNVESVASAPVIAAPAPRLNARPLSSIELSWWPPTASRPAQPPPSRVVSAKPPRPVPQGKAGPATFQRTRTFHNPESRNASTKPSAPAPKLNPTRRQPAATPATSASLATNQRAPATPAALPATAVSLATNLRTPAASATPGALGNGGAMPGAAVSKPLAANAIATAGAVPAAALVSTSLLDLRPAPAKVAAPAAAGKEMQQQIYAALHEYERGYERLDANAVRAVWPSVDARALARAFHDLKSQTLVFDRCDIDVARIQAVAACRGRATYETRVGDQALRTEPREWTFKLRKSDEAWQIVSASAR